MSDIEVNSDSNLALILAGQIALWLVNRGDKSIPGAGQDLTAWSSSLTKAWQGLPLASNYNGGVCLCGILEIGDQLERHCHFMSRECPRNPHGFLLDIYQTGSD